jgi:MSHA biogenesis protein MshQ
MILHGRLGATKSPFCHRAQLIAAYHQRRLLLARRVAHAMAQPVLWTGCLSFILCFAVLTPLYAATLLGEYRLEETTWNGLANEVKDASGNSRHGQMIGSPLPSPASTSPARSGNPGTCGYASLPGPAANGGAIRIPGLPVNTAPGAKTSVAFWMYWNGTDNTMPIGWNVHDLWLVGGFLGFNTGNSDVYGINSTGLAGGWHHVIAIFTNGNVAANALYIDGVAQVLSQKLSTPANANATVTATLQVGGWQGNTSYRFSGRIDDVKIYDGALTVGEVSALYTATHPCMAQPIAQWSMDESSWTGLAGEVTDSIGSFAGMAVNGATTSAASSARPGSPGTCAYGVFDGSNDYVTLPTLPNMATGFSITGWIRTTDRARPGQRVLIDDESNTSGYGVSLGDGGAGRLRFYARGSSTVILDTPAVINNNTWYFFAAVADISNGRRYLYVHDTAGALLASVSTASTGWGVDNGVASIGGETNASAESARHFVGNLDEIKVYTGALGASEVATLASQVHTCPIPPTLLAAYRFEDTAWNGTAGEVKDASGNNRHGVAVGSPYPVLANISPARTGSPGTCGYGNFAGGALNLPVNASTAPGDKTTVSFWMHWDGTNGIMPIGWNVHDLWLVGGFFGFNTGNSDVYGINSTGLANGWRHVTAVFTNGNVTANKLYIDGVPQALSQKLSTPNNGTAYANATLRVSGWLANTSYRFRSRVDEVKVYNGEILSAQVVADYNATHPCGGVTPPTNFNCIATAAPPATGTLATALAGAPYTFDVAALKSDGTVETTFASVSNLNVTLELVDGVGATACASRTPLSPAVTQTVTFTPADLGRKSVTVTSSRAYANLRCRVTDANQSPSIVACSSDNFAVRPGAVTLSATANAAPPSANAAPAIKAGAAFTLSANTITAPADNYAGALTLDTSRLTAQTPAQDVVQQNGGAIGTLSPATLTANTAVPNNANYTEAGYLYLAPGAFNDNSFTAVDQATGDCIVGSLADTLTGGKYGCVIGNKTAVALGRFIPDHFETQVSPSCGAFTYARQPFALTLTAKNATGGITQNYSAAFAKAATLSAANGIPGNFTPNPLPATVFVGGIANLTAPPSVSFSFASPLTAPTALVVRTTDSEGVTSATGIPLVEGNLLLRSGRLRLANAYGSELLPARVPVHTEFYSGTGWSINTADNCTVLPLNARAVSNVVGNVPVISGATPNPLPLVNGQATLIFDPTGLSGRFDLAANLNAAGPDTSCNAAHGGTAANLSWLQGFWSSTCNGTPPWQQDPNARIQLGAPRAPYIYLRERY